ncbi:MAG: GYD domain-containing protein [Thermoplasmata archaeon]
MVEEAEARSMPLYMLQFAYSHESWAAMLRKPEDRSVAIASVAKSMGGRLVSLYYHFGEFDGTAILEAPDDGTANALIFSVVASGSLRSTKTTRLYSPGDFMEALERAGKSGYQPPGKS